MTRNGKYGMRCTNFSSLVINSPLLLLLLSVSYLRVIFSFYLTVKIPLMYVRRGREGNNNVGEFYDFVFVCSLFGFELKEVGQ